MPNRVLEDALKIATSNLRACYQDRGIVAGNHHFTDYWARDGFFAAFGALALGDKKIVTKMLDLFFSFQRPDGLIPYRIMRGPTSLGKYLGKPQYYSTPRPTYRLRGFGQYVLDGTTLTLLFAALTKEVRHLNQIKLALKFLERHEKHNLLWDGVMAEWNDTALKWGNLLYSNIIYWYMYDRLANWAATFDQSWSQDLNNKKEIINEALRQQLWNGRYFADWHDYKRQDYFYPFGNCLAITWGLTTKSESDSILSECHKHIKGFTLETNSPRYPWWRIDPLQRLIGMGGYQNKSLLWWQPILSYLTALECSSLHKDARLILTRISSKVNNDRAVYECYDRTEQPFHHFIYQSESPFAWAAGMFIWAMKFSKDPLFLSSSRHITKKPLLVNA